VPREHVTPILTDTLVATIQAARKASTGDQLSGSGKSQ
jgi:hypothetical protein